MLMPLFSRTRCRNRKPRPPDKRAAAAFRPIYRPRFSSALCKKGSYWRRRLRASCRHDRLSALPDDLLQLILQRLDTRTALATATLSKRWACLPRCLGALDFRVSDILPTRFYQWIRIHGEAAKYTYGFCVDLKVLRANIERYERHAMRAMASSINNFLDADDDQERAGLGLRSVRTLRLELFAFHCSSGINRLIAKAADSWGVTDLEVSAKRTFQRQDFHSFPHHGLCNNPSRIRSLKLAACYLPPLKGFHALTSLVLQDLPKSTPNAAYEAIFTLCPQLQALHLKSCALNLGVVAINAPKSEIKHLILEHCWFGLIKLYTLPMLESMAVVHSEVSYELSSFPHLTHFNITYSRGVTKTRFCRVRTDYDLSQYLGGTSGITNLIIRFTGYDRWFKPWVPTLLLPKLRRLLIADVPSSWDVSWPRLLIEAAPCLESLHIHITPWDEEPRDDISWQPSEFCHNQLKELLIIGFQGTKRQIYFVNFVIKVSTSLQLVSLYKNGHVQDKEHCDWDMVTRQYQWVNEEKVKILNQIADSAPCAVTPIQVVLE